MFRYAPVQKYKTAWLIAVCLLAVFSVTLLRYRNKTQAQSAMAPQSLAGATNEQRICFLNDNGIKTDAEPYYVCDIIIPTSFDGIYQTFEAVQNAQGLSLSEYKGKNVRRFSYNVKNPPKNIEKAAADILVYDGEIIACALCSLTNNGGFYSIIG